MHRSLDCDQLGKHDVKTTQQTFMGGDWISRFDALRKYFGYHVRILNKTIYRPVLVVLNFSVLLAIPAILATSGGRLNLPCWNGSLLFIWVYLPRSYYAKWFCHGQIWPA